MRATALCPGFVDTPMAEWTGIDGAEMIRPEDCAELVRALLRLGPAARVPGDRRRARRARRLAAGRDRAGATTPLARTRAYEEPLDPDERIRRRAALPPERARARPLQLPPRPRSGPALNAGAPGDRAS